MVASSSSSSAAAADSDKVPDSQAALPEHRMIEISLVSRLQSLLEFYAFHTATLLEWQCKARGASGTEGKIRDWREIKITEVLNECINFHGAKGQTASKASRTPTGQATTTKEFLESMRLKQRC